MTLRDFLDEALVKGESLKEELLSEMMKSRTLKEFVQSDIFVNTLSTLMKTKDEVTSAIKHNVKTVLHIMDVPSRGELERLSRKIDQMEKIVDRAGKKAITVRSLKKIQLKKAAKKK